MKIICFIAVISLLMVSCNINYHDSISGNGKVKINQISTDTITHIIVSDRLDLTIVPSDSVKVLLKADENLHDIIHTTSDDGILRVNTSKYIRIARSKEVIVYGLEICQIEASAKTSVMTRDTIHCDEFTLITSSGADVKLTGRFKTCIINSSSGSNIYLEGKTDYLNINASSASDIFGYYLQAGRGDILASSASDVRITILDEAHFNASSAADIIYKGTPSVLDCKSSSLGEIRQARF